MTQRKLDDNNLTTQQELFCREYVKDLNGHQAAIRAGYSARSGYAIAAQMLAREKFQRRIGNLLALRAKKAEIEADDVLNELAKTAFRDVRKVFDDAGRVLPVSKWPDCIAASVTSMKVAQDEEKGTVIDVKLTDPKGALELIGKHLAMFTEKFQHTSPDGTMTPITQITKKIVRPRTRKATKKAKKG